MMDEFNHTVSVVIQLCLSEDQISRRVEIISRLIKIALMCREMNNFQSAYAIVSGLQSAPIIRLKHTWERIPKKRNARFKEVAGIFR